jgi:hypothetical protein
MRLSRKSHERLETFFRDFYGEEELKLPRVDLYVKRGAGLITEVFKIYGITFGKYIFIKSDLLYRNEKGELCVSKELLAHELTHVLQYQKLGWFRFFYTYLKGYWLALKEKEKWDSAARQRAYLEIPHEIEARRCAAKFMEWMSKMENGKLKIEN